MFRFNNRSVKTIQQSEVAECGLACLAMIANCHGHDIDLAYLRSMFPASRRGLTAGDIVRLSNHFGLDCRGFRVPDIADLSKLSLPAVLHWDGNHFVVLEAVKGRRYIVHDPAHGRRSYAASDMKMHFTGLALEFSARMDLEPVVATGKISLISLLGQIHGLKPALAKLIVLTLSLGLLALMMPVLLQIAIDMVLPQSDLDLLTMLAIALVCVMVFESAGKWLRDIVILRSAVRFQMQLTRGVLSHALRLPLSFFDAHHAGDIVTRLESVGQIKEFALSGLVRTLADGIMSLLVLVAMLYYSVEMTGIVVLTFAASMLIRVLYYPKAQQATADQLVARSAETSVLFDGLRQITALQSHAATGNFERKWFSKFSVVAEKDFNVHALQINSQLFVHIITAVGTVLTVYMGVAGVISSTLSVGMLYAFFSLRTSFFEKMESIASVLMQLSVLRAHVDRLEEIMRRKPEVNSRSTVLSRQLRSSLELSKVTVSFGTSNRPVLSNIDLSLDIGEREQIAIVGPSGSGKSTLLRVMAGLVRPTTGSVLLDKQTIDQFGAAEYRANIGAVFANDGLLKGTVAENVSLFDPNASFASVMQAIECVGLVEEIEALPQGIATLLSDEDGLLSTGQRRRLLAARAIYRRPKLMLFDEITANLDPGTEGTLLESIRRIQGAKVFVTHSERLLQHVDRVFEIRGGVLVECQKRGAKGSLERSVVA